MYIPYSMHGYQGFGLDVPTPLPGQPTNVSHMTATGYNYCGSKYGFQTMLQNLGYYSGAIDGAIGTGTNNAAKAFAADNGVVYGTDAFCQKLIDVWQQAMMPGPADVVVPQETPPAVTRPIRLRSDLLSSAVIRDKLRLVRVAQNGGSTTTAGADQGIIDKAKAWWSSQSTGTKVAVGLGAAAVVGLVLYAIFGGGSTPAPAYQANRRAPARGRRKMTRAAKSAARRARRLKGGFRKKYYSMGARRTKDYADPEHKRYPLVFRTKTGKIKRATTVAHIKSAKGYFTKHKHRYPMALRRKIARNINAANKRFHVGGKVMRP